MTTTKFETLKTFLIKSEEFTTEELESLTAENTYNTHCNTFDIMGSEYKVLTDAEATAEAKEEVINTLWAFNADFILQHTEFYKTSSNYENEQFVHSLQKLQSDLCEGANSIVKALIVDIDDFVTNAINADGRGHFLSYYDGEENEHGDFFIYRIN